MHPHKRIGLFVFAIILVAGIGYARAEWVDDGVLLGNYTLAAVPVIVSDGVGGAIIIWNCGDGNYYAQRIAGDGTLLWASDGIFIYDAITAVGGLCLVPDGAQGAIAVCATDGVSSGGCDLYAQRVDAQGNLLWNQDGVPISTGWGDANWQQAVQDGSGGAIITWHYAGTDVAHAVYTQRIDAGGNVLWTANGNIVYQAGPSEFVGEVDIASDGAGGAIITWPSPLYDDSNIYVQRVDASGNMLWQQNGVAICTAEDFQKHPRIAPDGSGGAIITWQDERTGYRAYAQKINASGEIQWTENGILVCSGVHERYPKIVSDGVGGAFIVWNDLRNSNWDLYAQRIDSDGNYLWDSEGVAVVTAPENQMEAELVMDEDGGIIVTWQDMRNGTYDIFAQRLDGDGNVKWIENGMEICNASGDQEYPVIVPNGNPGAIISWRDNRISRYVYAFGIDSYFDFTLPPCDITYDYLDFSSGQPTGLDFLVGCPHGDSHELLVNLDFQDAGMLRDIEPHEIWLDEPKGGIEFWVEHYDLNADFAATAGNGYTTTITHSVISGCGSDNVPVYWNGVSIGQISGLEVKSFDYNGDGCVDSKDSRFLNKTYNKCKGEKFYNDCFDYTGDECVSLADNQLFTQHYNHELITILRTFSKKYYPFSVFDKIEARDNIISSYPNPFNPSTLIEYSVLENSPVNLSIFSVDGRLVRTLVDEIKTQDTYRIAWDGKNNQGRAVVSGIYYCVLRTSRNVDSKKLIVIR